MDKTADDDARRVRRQVLKWALMLVALFWTLVYRAAQGGGGVPEFMYVNF